MILRGLEASKSTGSKTTGVYGTCHHRGRRYFHGYPKSQPRTGHTREPDPTHNELKHTSTTRKTATHERTRAGEVRARWSPAHPYPSSTFTCPRRASIDAFTSQGPGPARPRRRGPELCLEHCLLPFLPPPKRQYSTLSRDERARARTSGARDEERQRGIRAGRVGFRAFGIHFGGGTRDRSTNRPSPGPGGEGGALAARWSKLPMVARPVR